MQFAGQERRSVVVLQLESHVATDEARGQHRAGGRVRVHFDLDRRHFVRVGRQTQLVEQATKADECAADYFSVIHLEFQGIALGSELRLNHAQVGPKVVLVPGSFQGKVRVFGIANAGEEEPERCAAVEGERDHRSAALERPQKSAPAGIRV